MGEELRLALLGDPVQHSLSPLMQGRAMEEAGVRGRYETILADVSRLQAELEAARRGQWDGLNVTMPLKRAAAEMCDVLTPEARRSGSVNTIKSEGDELAGHSTDVVAFASILSGWGQAPLHILGAGGSARAALAASERPSYVAGRRLAAARELARDFDAAPVAWGTAVVGAIVVNATPLGMGGESLPTGLLETASALIDLPYRSGATPAAGEARARDLPTVDGIDFLARQAAASFTWWTGRSVDSDAMAELARNV